MILIGLLSEVRVSLETLDFGIVWLEANGFEDLSSDDLDGDVINVRLGHVDSLKSWLSEEDIGDTSSIVGNDLSDISPGRDDSKDPQISVDLGDFGFEGDDFGFGLKGSCRISCSSFLFFSGLRSGDSGVGKLK